jgi:hypothetical protein
MEVAGARGRRDDNAPVDADRRARVVLGGEDSVLDEEGDVPVPGLA